MSDDVGGRKYYVILKCPDPDNCNPKNFKGWNTWGWTQKEAQDALFKHLKMCGHHKESKILNEAAAAAGVSFEQHCRNLADGADVVEKPWNGKWPPEQNQPAYSLENQTSESS